MYRTPKGCVATDAMIWCHLRLGASTARSGKRSRLNLRKILQGMWSLVPSSISALSQAFTWEFERARSNPSHGMFDISCKLDILSNGIRHCSVQVRCMAECGWLVETFGSEAEALERKVRHIQFVLKESSVDPSRCESELLQVLFQECLIQGHCVVPSSEEDRH
jgi:hypothetical protein